MEQDEEKELAKAILLTALRSTSVNVVGVITLKQVREELLRGCLETADDFMRMWEHNNTLKPPCNCGVCAECNWARSHE